MAPTYSPDVRVRAIMGRPVWTFEEMGFIFGIAPQTLEKAIREYPVDGMFTVGRKRHVMQEAAMAWIQTMPEYQRRSYNKAAA